MRLSSKSTMLGEKDKRITTMASGAAPLGQSWTGKSGPYERPGRQGSSAADSRVDGRWMAGTSTAEVPSACRGLEDGRFEPENLFIV